MYLTFLFSYNFLNKEHLLSMDKEFEDYWNLHQRHLILSAPEKLRSEYMEAGRLDSPADWVCFILPVGVGILLQPFLNFSSEILSWAIVLVVVVLLFVLKLFIHT